MQPSPENHIRTLRGGVGGPPPQRLPLTAIDQPSRRERAIAAAIASKRSLTRAERPAA
jgi:hypothetical protein